MYDLGQQRDMAREIVRSGGCAAKAVDVLKTQYETFEKIHIGTLRRFMRMKPFQKLMREAETVQTKARKAGELTAEKLKAENAALGKNDLRHIAIAQIGRLSSAEKKDDLNAAALCLKYMEFLARIDGYGKPESDGRPGSTRPEDDQ